MRKNSGSVRVEQYAAQEIETREQLSSRRRRTKITQSGIIAPSTADRIQLCSSQNRITSKESCEDKEKILKGSIVSPSYHTGDYHLSLYIHDLCLS